MSIGETPRRKRDGPDRGDRLEQPVFEKLLAFLDPNRDRAGEAYERLRRQLTRFFQWHGATSPEELADRTMDRVGQKIESGRVPSTENSINYFYGVARKLLHEHWNEQKRTRSVFGRLASGKNWMTDPHAMRSAADNESLDRRLGCLERCLQDLSPQDRTLIVEYYTGLRDAKIANRKGIAEGLGIGLNALRIRAFRLRSRLETCVEECLKTSGK